MSIKLSNNLKGLNDREAITDALYRAVMAFDLNDFNLLESALTKDANFILMGNSIKTLDLIKSQSLSTVGPLDTGHLIGNIRIDFKDENTANLSAFALSNHLKPQQGSKPGSPYFMVGAYYYAIAIKQNSSNTEKDLNIWKLNFWELKPHYQLGDPSVMQ